MKIFVAFLFMVGLAHAQWVKQMENENPTATLAGEDEDAERFVEGDILMTKAEYAEMLTGEHTYGSKIGGRWPDPTRIPYEIHSSLQNIADAKRGIAAAMNDYKKYLCLQFVPRTTEKAYLRFGDFKRGCSSHVGYRGVINDISLVRGCWHKGTIMHEIGHSLGLWHEQSRPDRDNYVQIQTQNIQSKYVYNFNKMGGINSLGTTYDYLSMMHYGRTAFSKNGQITIKTKQSSYQNRIGQRSGLSAIDKQQIKRMYPSLPSTCDGSITMKSATASSVFNNDPAKWGAQLAWTGESNGDTGYFHSKQETNPWLQIEFTKPEKLSSVTIINRINCCGERLKNLQIRAGLNSVGLQNKVVGEFKGPGANRGSYEITFKQSVTARFVTFQIIGGGILQINGLRWVKDEITMKLATASSVYSNKPANWGAQLAWTGESNGNTGFFHSEQESNPLLQIEFTKPERLSSVTIINRIDCCGERLRNLQIRAGLNPVGLKNKVVGEFKGPGSTRDTYEITLNQPVTARFVTFQIIGGGILQINGLRFNQEVKAG